MKYPLIAPSFFQHFAWLPLRLSLWLFCRLNIKGVENITSLQSPLILASNHTHELDPLLIVACLPFFSKHLPLYFVSREKTFYKEGWRRFVYGGTFFRMMGAYPATVGLRDYERALHHHIKLIQEEKNVVIFPTGKIVLGDEPSKPRGGVSFLAEFTHAPILPINIEGIENMTLVDFLSRKRNLVVTFGKPLYGDMLFRNTNKETDDTGRNYYEEGATVLMKEIARLS